MPHADELLGLLRNMGSAAPAGSHTHSDASTSASGFMSGADKTKVDGITEGATANATDAQLRDRATHTGSQAIATVTGLQTALDGKAPVGSGGASLVSAFLTATQPNSTVTPAILTNHSFTLTPGQVLQLVGQVVCTAAATSTGFAVGIRVAQAAGAGGNAQGSACIQTGLSNAAAATQLFDADVFNVAAGASAFFEVLGTASTTGNNGAGYHLAIKNNGTTGNTTVTVEFRSEVGTSAVTAQIGTGCAGVRG